MTNTNTGNVALFNLEIRDLQTLAALYMPFVKNGGLFIPTKGNQALGERVFLLVRLPDTTGCLPACASVIWVAQGKLQKGRCAGVGIRFADRGSRLKNRIDALLSPLDNKSFGSMTMA